MIPSASGIIPTVSSGRLPPPLSPERVRIARELHGDAPVDRYMKHLAIGDPLADAVVAHFDEVSEGRAIRVLNRVLNQGVESVSDPPPELAALVEQLNHVPDWVDWREMRHASKRILQNGLLTGLAFAAYALPHCYLATTNMPLAFTGRLLGETALRYGRTVRFVIESFMPDGLRREADGFRMAVMVRAFHARVRREILNSGRWDSKRYGVPLNQSHMATNTIFFSLYVVEGLRRLGVRLTRRERESVMLTWRYVSYLLGVNDEIAFQSEAEARDLAEVAFSLELEPDETSKKLYRSMIEAGPGYMQIDSDRLARAFTGVVRPMSRHLLGDQLARQLGFSGPKHHVLCQGIKAFIGLSERMPWLLPNRIRNYMGVEFWLSTGLYGPDLEDSGSVTLS